MSGRGTSGVSTLEGHWLFPEHPNCTKSGLGKLDLPSSICVHLPAHNKVGLWRCCFIDRLPLSQGTQKGKNQKTRQALLGENTNEDKFPLSVSKEFFLKLFDIISKKCKQWFQHFSSESISLSDNSLSLSLSFPPGFPQTHDVQLSAC